MLKWLLRFPYYVKVITQFVGYIVYVPPQWMHAVFTVQKCLKLSWEVVEPLHFFNYAKVWSQQQTAMPDPAKDYTAFMHIATNYLTSGRWTLCWAVFFDQYVCVWWVNGEIANKIKAHRCQQQQHYLVWGSQTHQSIRQVYNDESRNKWQTSNCVSDQNGIRQWKWNSMENSL